MSLAFQDIKIGDVCEVGDGAHATIKREESGVLYLSSRNFKDGQLDLSKVFYISEESFAKHFKEGSKALTKTQAGDVALSIIGTIGEPYVVKSTDRFGLSSAVAFMRPDPKRVDSNYLYYWLKSPEFQQAVYAVKGGVAQGYVSLEMMRGLPFRSFPLDVQISLAGTCKAYDNLIENNNRRIAILEDMAQSLYREWFVKFRFPGHEKVKFKDSPLGQIPGGWNSKLVSDVIKRQRAGEKYKQDNVEVEGNVPVIDQSRSELLGYHNNEADHIASPVQPIAIFGDHTCKMQLMVEPFSVGPNVVPFIPKIEYPPAYIFYLVSSLVETKEYKRHWTELNSKDVVLASLDIANQFSELVEPFLNQISKYKKSSIALRKSRDLLLPKLISGNIEV